MRMNTLAPAPGSKQAPKRLGRGIGSGLGKTCGRGHKGQTARTGKGRRIGFEGGQMPLQRRLPKMGFNSMMAQGTDEIRLEELNQLIATNVSLETLREAGLINGAVKRVKIILKGKVDRAMTIAADIRVTAGAKALIEAAGGKVEA
ncbi:MAG: 50S ribosomal protein L15 [Proteobacteria bacterium]|nr:50S ribosomal protein L15 [Pseudomonadota bacterium]